MWNICITLVFSAFAFLASGSMATDAASETTKRILRPEEVQETVRKLEDAQQSLSLIEIVAQLFILGRLEAYLNFGQSSTAFAGEGPYTVFMPWTFAWDTLDTDLTAKLQNPSRSWLAHLVDILEYHIADDDFPEDILLNISMVPARNEEFVMFTELEGTTHILANDAQILASYTSTNGNAHIIGKVLLPSWVERTMWDLVSSLEGFDTLLSLLVSGDLESNLRDPEAGITILAPTDDAFNSVDTADALALLLDPQLQQDTILLHVVVGYVVGGVNVTIVDGPIPSQLLTTSRALATAQGTTLELTPGTPANITGPRNTAAVIQYDELANNGILHQIDTLLLL